MTTFEATYAPTPDQQAEINRAYLWHRQGTYILLSLLIALIALWRLAGGKEPALWSFWLGALAVFWYLWIQGLSAARRRAEKRGQVAIRLTVDPEGLTLRTSHSSSWFQWSEVLRTHQLKPALLLDLRHGLGPVLIPAQALNQEQKDLLLSYVRSARK
jgi:hypothetical protein